VSLYGKRLRGRSIFRKTAIIFVIVSLAPVTILGLRSHHIYADQLNLMVDTGVLTRQEADGQVRDMEVQAVTYGGYGLVIALILGYFFASSLVQPIRTLQQGARKIGDGNLEHRVETDTEDELEELATTINQMAESLQTREIEVSRRNRDLSILYEVAHTMAESRDQGDLLGSALDKAMEITGSTSGCVLLHTVVGELEPVICRSSQHGDWHKPACEIYDRAAAAATRSGDPVVFDYSAINGPDDEGSLDAVACVPLKFEGKLQGAICVTGTRQDFPREKLDLMSAIGSEVAVAIENTRLFEKLEAQNRELAQATSEIATLIQRAEEQKSFGIRYQNPDLVRCWEFKNCRQTECPAFGAPDNLRCWQVAGTHCGGEVQGVFAQKLGRCERCDVFAAACPDKITHLGETFNNMMAVLERRVDEQEELQRQLFNSSKLAAIGELAAGVAHEINNPLTGILGSALLMKSQQLDPAAMEKKLSIIESETLRARDIVRNLLDFAHQGENVARAPVSVTKLIDHTLSLLGHQTDLRSFNVETEFQNNLPEITVDANQMQQVFLNIINNAIHAMPDGGHLTIAANRSPVTAERQALEISFSDTGAGMDAVAVSRIFDPFYTTKRVGEGTGLGLSVSQRIVDEHGGEILVASESGKGSTFTVVLPAAPSVSEERKNVA
jgi:signal transduction histidine kinase